MSEHSLGKTSQEVPPPIRELTLTEVMNSKKAHINCSRYSQTSVLDYLKSISEAEVRDKYVVFHKANPYYDQVCAGAKHHHWWIGGLTQHVCQMIGFCFDLFDLYAEDLQNKITRDDIIIACYLHDFSKVWTYGFITDEDREKAPRKYDERQVFKPMYGAFDILTEEDKTLLYLSRFGIIPTEIQWSAVCFAEGGWAQDLNDFGGRSQTSRTIFSQNPLAVLLHMADLYSSQVLGGSIA